MPKITLDKERVIKIVGKNLDDNQLKHYLGYLGTDVESITKQSIEVEIFPNRPDLLSGEGLGRALRSFIGKEKGLRIYSARKSNYQVIIDKSVKKVRPHTACAVIKGLKLDEKKIEDIIDIQEKLHVTYGRNRKKCAIGIYPLENISFPIIYKALPKEKVRFVPLGHTKEISGIEILKKHEKGKEYAYLLEKEKEFPLFIDKKGIIMSMPPIINSEDAGKVSLGTKDFFVECSGHDFKVLSKALNMVVAALSDMGGIIYEVDLVNEKKKTPELGAEKFFVEKSYIEKIVGVKISDNKIVESLEKMGFGVSKKKNGFLVMVPCYRVDILQDVDIVEDVAIGFGYNKIEEDNVRLETPGEESFNEVVKGKIRELLSGHGLLEAKNYYLSGYYFQKKYFYKNVVKVKNALSEEYDSLRFNIFGSLLKTLKFNKHHDYPQEFFEIGKVFYKKSSEESGVLEEDALGVVFCGENANFTLAKQHLDSVFSLLGLKYDLVDGEDVFMMKGRCGIVKFKGRVVGVVGEINPVVLSDFELKLPVSGFEIVIDDLFDSF